MTPLRFALFERHLVILAFCLAILHGGPLALGQPAAGASFTRIISGLIATEVKSSVGCAWGDFNRDGFMDLFVANTGGPNSLFLNDMAGGFVKITDGAIATDRVAVPHSATWIDYDNDGDLDMIVSAFGSPNVIYSNDGNGSFVRVAGAGSLTSTIANSASISWADYDNDGHLDAFVANGAILASEKASLHRNRGDATFALVPTAAPSLEARASFQGAWADFDNDGDADLFVTHHANQNNSLFRNEGSGAFTKITSGSIVNDGGNSVSAVWGDYDNDGFQDLFVSNWSESGPFNRNFLYHNTGSGEFSRITSGEIASAMGQFAGAAWGDYDNDGHLDLFVAEHGSGKNLLYRNNGNGTFTGITEGSPVNDLANSGPCAWGDYDNDGFLDLFVSNGALVAPQTNFLYRNNGNANRWIKIRLVGTISNRPAIGAKVRVKAQINGRLQWQMREVSGGSGNASQNTLELHFGLGDAPIIEAVRIEWPSGIVQHLAAVAVNQTLKIIEPVSLKAIRQSGRFDVGFKGGRFRTHRLEASPNLVDWTPLARLTATGSSGQVSFQDSERAGNRFFRAAATEVQTLIDIPLPDRPEGIALDPHGNIFFSIAMTGEIKKLAPDGTLSTYVRLQALAAGLCSDRTGRIYAAISPMTGGGNAGVWRIETNGQAMVFATLPPNSLANDVVFDSGQNLFVTDSIGGRIFKVSTLGALTEWTADPLLRGAPNPQEPHPPFPIGANGLAFFKTNVFVSNTDLGTIVRIPINPDGSAGAAALYSSDPRLFGADGVVADLTGNLYVANIIQNTILRVTPQGSLEVLADARDGLDGPSSLRFGSRVSDRGDLFFVNYAFLSAALGGAPKPSVMIIPVITAGVSIP